MELDSNNKIVNVTSTTDSCVPFSDVAVIAKRWMIDFTFLSLCKFFKEQNFKEFNQAISTLEAILDGIPHLKHEQKQKRLVCGFLSRVMHGKHLDITFDRDERLTPLMSAVGVWASLNETVADDTLFRHVSNLLYVQCVAVCLDKGNVSMASSALQWLEEDCQIPQNLTIKLSMIVSKRDTYHPFLRNFSWPRLLEKIHTFLDTFLDKHPSDFLFQAATKVVQVSEEKGARTAEESKDQESDLTSISSEHCKDNEETAVLIRPKKKLLSTGNVQPWNPGSCKKSVPHSRRTRVSMRLTYRGTHSPQTSLNTTAQDSVCLPNTSRKTHRKWSWDLDRALKAGVKQHGEGRWSRILLGHDFQGRTGVQLKDRWRTLKRTGQVDAD
ncbi:telomeric repeat-binding factor 1 [Esox lucius]|uniref:Telomeric repeat-binding factor n=1 Tax=Esox lucius TaxID=8010 RepID=A0A3P8ZPQ1_ESOLU|nr:telomeric repeat-binding factor 1 [Esox lucius]